MESDDQFINLDSKLDVFDGEVEKIAIEKQLLSETSFTFTLKFSNYKDDHPMLLCDQIDSLS